MSLSMDPWPVKDNIVVNIVVPMLIIWILPLIFMIFFKVTSDDPKTL